MSDPLSIPPSIPGYELLSLLGQGGMGKVWKARKLASGEEVALKVLHEQGGRETVVRFERESSAMALLHHPNVVRLLSRGRAGKTLFYTMELVNGSTLRHVQALEPLSPAAAVQLVAQVASGLAHAHRLGVVHRDIKPDNILVTPDRIARLTDFGIAAVGTTSEARRLTQTGIFFGTSGYAAPEQQRSTRRADIRSDIYSLGVVLYEVLCGELPLGRFELPSKRVKDIDPALDAIVATALAQNPNERFRSVGEMETALHQVHRRPAEDLRIARQVMPGKAITLGATPRYIDVRFGQSAESEEMEAAISELKSSMNAPGPKAIAYDLQHPNALPDEMVERLAILHQNEASKIERVGLAADIPLVRGSAAALAAAVPKVQAAVFASVNAMHAWIERGKSRGRTPEVVGHLGRVGAPRHGSHTPLIVRQAIQTWGWIGGLGWLFYSTLRLTYMQLIFGHLNFALVATIVSFLHGAPHCCQFHYRGVSLGFFKRTRDLLPLSEHELLDLMSQPERVARQAMVEAFRKASMPEQAALTERTFGLIRGDVVPESQRDRLILTLLVFGRFANRACVAEQTPLLPAAKGRQARAYAEACLADTRVMPGRNRLEADLERKLRQGA